jgi:hypothetical protein
LLGEVGRRDEVHHSISIAGIAKISKIAGIFDLEAVPAAPGEFGHPVN